MDEIKCLNCGVRLTLMNWAMGREWRHDPTRQHRDTYTHCKIHRATPPTKELREQATGHYKFRVEQGSML